MLITQTLVSVAKVPQVFRKGLNESFLRTEERRALRIAMTITHPFMNMSRVKCLDIVHPKTSILNSY